VGHLVPQLSAFFEEAVYTLLRKERDERFAGATDLLAALEAGEESAWWRARSHSIRAATKRPIRRIRIPRETAVYGREAEIAQLRALYEAARSGDGQVVLIEGEAGIGKSRLTDELIGRLQADGEDLNFLFGSYPPGGAASASGAFSSAFHEQIGDGGAAPYLPQTPLLVPAFDALLRGDAPPRDAHRLTQHSLGACFAQVARGLATERTTVILIDDLHFAPAEARALFAALSMAVPGHRILLLGSTRPGVSEEWRSGLTRLDQTTHLELPRLGPKDLVALLRDSLGSERLAEELGGKIGVKSDGNPFFAFEIIRGLREGQFLTQRDDGTWATTRIIDEIQIPSSVLDLVNARVADLTEEQRDLLDVACCWGFEFDPGLVGDVLGIGRIPLLKRFGQIERGHRLVRAAGRNYVFDHHQVQEALYATLHEQIREEYHAALADALAARSPDSDPETLDGATSVDLCGHYLRGGRGADALRHLRAAQDHLSSSHLHVDMVSLTERALAVPGLLTELERARVLHRLATGQGPLDSMGRREQQERYARESERLAEAAGDTRLRANAAGALGWCLYQTSDWAGAETALRRSLRVSTERGDDRTAATALSGLGNVYQSQGRTDEALDHHLRAGAILHASGDFVAEAATYGHVGFVHMTQGRIEEATEQCRRQLEICREHGFIRGEVNAMASLGLMLWSAGQLRDAQGYMEQHVAYCRDFGDGRGESIGACNLGLVFHTEGRIAEAREQFERSLSLSGDIGDREGEAMALHNLAVLLREEGRLDDSESLLGRSLATCERADLPCSVAAVQLELGSLRAERSREGGGDGEEGRDALVTARDLATEIGMAGTQTLSRCELALLPGGDVQDALAAFAEFGDRLNAQERAGASLLLWEASRDAVHLLDGRRLLDEVLATVPPEYHASTRQNIRVHREIVAACEAQGL
jgi:tetratricopeptide (TPR) repeat protein